MMLNQQEEVASDTSINRTIDQMLEQPTVYPGSDAQAAKEREEAARRFAEDEFMLDNPTAKK